MNDTTSTFGLPEAASRFGVSIRVLRRAMRAGTIPAPANLTATVALSDAWFDSALAAFAAAPDAFSGTVRQKVPAFARYEGTSSWTQFRNRVRAYAQYKAALSAN